MPLRIAKDVRWEMGEKQFVFSFLLAFGRELGYSYPEKEEGGQSPYVAVRSGRNSSMDTRLIALKLFLDELKVPSEIHTINERKRLQKAIYLGQAAGADLGYRFGWYLRGPYSPILARDYYGLTESVASGEQDTEERELRASTREQLQRVRPLLEPPDNVHLPQADWLELLSSLHYQRIVRGLDGEAATQFLQRNKPSLVAFVPIAQESLREVNLLP